MMASALMGGLVKARAVPSSSSIAVSEPYTPMREKHLKNGFAATTSNAEVVQRSDTIVLAVKPDVIPAVLRECAAAVGTAKLVVSIAAGVPLRAQAHIRGGARNGSDVLNRNAHAAAEAETGESLLHMQWLVDAFFAPDTAELARMLSRAIPRGLALGGSVAADRESVRQHLQQNW